jgi:hypothetical protein
MRNKKHPKAIFIQLNTYCNATCINCPHVFTYKTIHEKGSMNEKTWHKIITDLIEMDYNGQVGFYLHHEPLTDVTLFDKIKDVNLRTNAHVVISTNGALLNEKNRQKLIEAKPKTVHININSGIKEEYERSMGLNFKSTIENAQNFIREAEGSIRIEINCPVMEGYDVKSLEKLFPNTKVNLDYYANSRGGLIPELYGQVKGSRFKIEEYCVQPSQNFNILFNGSVILCCIDWMHESKNDYGNINDSSIAELYSKICEAEENFEKGDYSKYKMCEICSVEMGFHKKSEKDIKLNILITNHHLDGYTGSEIFTLTLAKSLKDRGHTITVYSKYIGEIENEFREYGINLVENLNEIKDIKFDVAHIHHNISLVEVRNIFPNLPVVFLSQGVLPFLEHPPFFNLNVSRYIAISEEIKKEFLKNGISEKDIDMIGNLIDIQKFSSKNQIKDAPHKALVISAKINAEKEQVIKEACKELNIELEFIGGRFGVVNQNYLASKVESADIIFSLGRGAIEGMIAGKCVIVYDYLGGDGIVNSKTFHEIKKNNFSGRRYKKEFNAQTLIDEIKKYDKKEIEIVKELAVEEYSSELATLKLERIYRDIIKSYSYNGNIKNYNLVKFINNVIAETFSYAITKGMNISKANDKIVRTNDYYDKRIINELNKYLLNLEQNISHPLKKDIVEKALKELKNIPEQEKLLLITNCEKLVKEKKYFDALVLLENNRSLLSEDLRAHELERNIYDKVKISNQNKKWNSSVCNVKMKKAEKYFNENKVVQAESTLLEIVNAELFNIEAVNNLSIASLALQKEDRALELIKYVHHLDPENESAKETYRFIQDNNIDHREKIKI